MQINRVPRQKRTAVIFAVSCFLIGNGITFAIVFLFLSLAGFEKAMNFNIYLMFLVISSIALAVGAITRSFFEQRIEDIFLSYGKMTSGIAIGTASDLHKEKFGELPDLEMIDKWKRKEKESS